MLLVSLFYLLQPAYAGTKYILNIHYESGPIWSIQFEGYSEDADELIAASKSKENAYVKFKDYIDRNDITIIDSSAEKPIVRFSGYERNTTINQVYHIHSYDVGEIVCTTIGGEWALAAASPYTYCKTKSQVLEIKGIHSYSDEPRIIHIKKFGDKFIATGAERDFFGRPLEVVVEIRNNEKNNGIFK